MKKDITDNADCLECYLLKLSEWILAIIIEACIPGHETVEGFGFLLESLCFLFRLSEDIPLGRGHRNKPWADYIMGQCIDCSLADCRLIIQPLIAGLKLLLVEAEAGGRICRIISSIAF